MWHTWKCRVRPSLALRAQSHSSPEGKGQPCPHGTRRAGHSPRLPTGVVLIPCSRTYCLFEKENFVLLLLCMVYGQLMFYQLWRMRRTKCYCRENVRFLVVYLTGILSFPRAWIFLPYRRSRSSLMRLSIMVTSMLRLFKSSFCCWSFEFCSWLSWFRICKIENTIFMSAIIKRSHSHW